jgi:hypothetical protein
MLYLIFGLWMLTFGLVAMQTKRQKEGGLARVEWKLDALLKKLEITLPDLAADPELLGLAKAGRKIEAIKRYRDITGAGLKEAKDFVERL